MKLKAPGQELKKDPWAAADRAREQSGIGRWILFWLGVLVLVL